MAWLSQASLVLASDTKPCAGKKLSEAIAHYRLGELDKAYKTIHMILEQGGLCPKDLSDAHYYLGILEGAQGNEAQAQQHFDLSLLIEPDRASAPIELGPTLRSLVDRASLKATNHPLRVDLVAVKSARRGQDVVLDVRVRPHQVFSLSRIEIAAADPALREHSLRSSRIGSRTRLVASKAVWPQQGPLVLDAILLDSFGNRILQSRVSIEETPVKDKSVLKEPWLWLTVAGGIVVAGAAATTVGVLVSGQPENTQQDVYIVGTPVLR